MPRFPTSLHRMPGPEGRSSYDTALNNGRPKTITAFLSQVLFGTRRAQSGQMSFFFVLALSLCLTLMAFIINVGLFIKAKINLQNATDAAAWAGAAVQARQLTDIGYLNWEMRNVYKEWMFKYYVLGNLSSPGIRSPGSAGNNLRVNPTGMDFTLGPSSSTDRINLPSICIHQRSSANDNDVCSIYKIPGLPRLSTPVWGSLDETTSIYTDILSQVKANDCAVRSKANFMIALSWAFGTGIESNNQALFDNLGAVAAQRPGAWVQALELAIRIRNLETMVNESPKDQGVCLDPGLLSNPELRCAEPVQTLETQGNPAQERTVKAFYSAFRNLGNDDDREMKDSFVLTELSPKPLVDNTEGSLSTLLSGQTQSNKYYLDLRLYSLNLAYFYSLLATVSRSADQSPLGVGSDAECQMLKMALPIPGYPFGFEKNPQLLTYYAVKGEAAFQGLFNPFAGQITLRTFSAAKPFGARLGPRLFQFSNDLKFVFPRSWGNVFRSAAYLFGITLGSDIKELSCDPSAGPTTDKCIPPIMPNDQDFWASDANDAIGGTDLSRPLKYVVPNLWYDNESSGSAATSPLFIYPIAASASTPHQLGLFNIDQYKEFQKNLAIKPEISAADINEAISNARAPTLYETQNYLIPTPHLLNQSLKLDSFGIASLAQNDGLAPIYAPIYGEFLPFKGPTEINRAIRQYLEQQKPAVQNYLITLGKLAETFRQMQTQSATANRGKDIYQEAANTLHDDTADLTQLTCQSVAGKMYYFFFDQESNMTNTQGCPRGLAQELENLYGQVLFNQAATTRLDKNFHYLTFNSKRYEELNLRLFNSFFPGKLQGGASSPGSIFQNPFSLNDSRSARNFYSTKLISLESLLNAGSGRALYSEGSSAASPTGEEQVLNLLELTQDVARDELYQ